MFGHLPPPPQSGPAPVRPRPSQAPPSQTPTTVRSPTQSGRQQVSPVPVFKSFILIWALQGGKVSLIGETTFSWVLPAGLGLLCLPSLTRSSRETGLRRTNFLLPTHEARSRMEVLNSQWKTPTEDPSD